MTEPERKIRHDLNNLLMSISPWAEVLKRRYPDDPTIQKAAAAIADAVEAGRRIGEEIRSAFGR